MQPSGSPSERTTPRMTTPGPGGGKGATTSGGSPGENRPTPVTVVSLLLWVGGALTLLAGFGFLAGSADVAPAGGVNLAGLALFGGLFFLIVGLAEVYTGYGLWTRRRWAWYAAIALAGVALVLNLFELIRGNVMSAIVGLAIAATIIVLLFRPDVQSWFEIEVATPWTAGRPT